ISAAERRRYLIRHLRRGASELLTECCSKMATHYGETSEKLAIFEPERRATWPSAARPTWAELAIFGRGASELLIECRSKMATCYRETSGKLAIFEPERRATRPSAARPTWGDLAIFGCGATPGAEANRGDPEPGGHAEPGPPR